MHITDIMRGDSPTFSFEFFPPKTPEAAEILYQTIRDLESYMPHFVSVTYGAGGSTRDLTHDLVERIQHHDKTGSDPSSDLRLPQRRRDRSDSTSIRQVGDRKHSRARRRSAARNCLRQIARLVSTRDRSGEVHSPIQRIGRASGSARFWDRRGRFS